MKNFKGIFTLAVFTLCLAAAQMTHAAEDHNAKIKAEMVQNYLLWEIAWKNRDAERIISFESPDFTVVDSAKTVHRKPSADDSWRDTINSIQKIYKIRVEIKKMTIESNRVVVLSRHQLDMSNRFSPSRRDSIILDTRDTWVEYDRSWMLKRTEILKVLINGKPRP